MKKPICIILTSLVLLAVIPTIAPISAVTCDPFTFTSEAALDGHIVLSGTTYPPTTDLWVGTEGVSIPVGQGGAPSEPFYFICRGYLSFDTSSIPDSANITSVELRLATDGKNTENDFTVEVRGGQQPIYGSSLEITDWECGTTIVGTWNTVNYPGDLKYIEISIPCEQVNKDGRTQFGLRTDREGIDPSPNLEWVFFGSGDGVMPPILEVTWQTYDTIVKIDEHYWYYWNSTTNEKAAIFLSGGIAGYNNVYVVSHYNRSTEMSGGVDWWSSEREAFILDLQANGFGVLSPKNDSDPYPYRGTSYYSGTQNWVKDAATWLKCNQSYKHVFLFGFSAGGVVVAKEIQRDYATIFSAAVVASAPVDNDTYGAIFNSADTASEAKVCTSFIGGVNDVHRGFGNLTEQMRHYYDNMVVHKEWHLWENGHDVFQYTCLIHPEETVFDVAYNWYQHRHSLTVLAQDQYGNSLTTGDVYIHGQLEGYTNSTFPELGTHEVFVNAFWENGSTGYRYGFKNWTDGVGDNPRNITVVEDTTITANFTKKWCPGDVDGNGEVDIVDIVTVAIAFGSTREEGDPWPPSGNWDSRADVNCDGLIDIVDIVTVQLYFGNTY